MALKDVETILDIAALSAEVIAVVVSLFIAPGPYDIESLVISSTLVVIIFGYVWTNPRWWLQSLAVATAIALASLPGAGFIYETARSESPVAYLVG